MNNNTFFLLEGKPVYPKVYCRWKPRPGWLVLLPSRTAPKKGSIILPESETKKTNSGICILAGTDLDKELFLGKECFFANHTEFGIKDSETGWLLYVLNADKVLLWRDPPPEVATFSREKVEGLTFETITHDQKP